jgi:hypothetical protein
MAFEVQDEFEALVLEFLTYRRKKRKAAALPEAYSVKPPAVIPRDIPAAAKPKAALPLLADIGKGWPEYKALALPDLTGNKPQAGPGNEIIRLLEPIVREMLARFGRPDTASAMAHLNHQVLAQAMAVPLVGESMRAEEARPWGRVALLQAVVELLLRNAV